MAVKFSTTVRNARLDAVESAIGTSAIIEIRSGSVPANPAASNTGSVLVTYTLGSDWTTAASSGTKQLNDLPISGTASGTGTASYFRIYNSGNVCHWQGSVTDSGGGGDMIIDNTSIATGQAVNITSFSVTDGNA